MGATHVGGAAALLAQPASWPWAVSAMGASHALAMAFSFDATSGFLGPVVSRLPAAAAARGEIALTFDDGPDPEVTPRLLDILDAHSARATFFCIAHEAQRHPALARAIVARGHGIENHSLAHSIAIGFFGWGRLRREIEDAQQILADITGTLPHYYRPPFGVRTPLTEPVLARLGLHCVGWNVRSYDTVDESSARVAARVLRGMAPGSIVLMHDGVRVRQRRPGIEASVLEALPRVLQAIGARGAKAVTLRAGLA
jgi:peptidoglycan/xylan/chitin deacetylase (PgdA/CDA1 family)